MSTNVIWTCTHIDTSIGDNFDVDLRLQNNGQTPVSAGRVWIVGDGYVHPGSIMHPAIQPHQIVSVKLHVRVKGGVTVMNLPSVFQYEMRQETTTVSSTRFLNRMFSFANGLARFPRPKCGKYNILLFGESGQGKSAFVNTLISMLMHDVTLSAAKAGTGIEHNTTAVDFVDMKQHNLFSSTMKDAPFVFVDPWGLTEKNYKGNELSCMVRGLLLPGTGMDDQKTINKAVKATTTNKKALFAQKTQDQRRAHAVLFFFNPALLDDERTLANIRAEFIKIGKEGLMPIVLISHADDWDESIRQNPMNWSAEMKELQSKVAQALNVPVGAIFPCVPNITLEKNFELERLAYLILETALQSARTYALKLEKREDPNSGARYGIADDKLGDFQDLLRELDGEDEADSSDDSEPEERKSKPRARGSTSGKRSTGSDEIEGDRGTTKKGSKASSKRRDSDEEDDEPPKKHVPKGKASGKGKSSRDVDCQFCGCTGRAAEIVHREPFKVCLAVCADCAKHLSVGERCPACERSIGSIGAA